MAKVVMPDTRVGKKRVGELLERIKTEFVLQNPNFVGQGQGQDNSYTWFWFPGVINVFFHS